MAEHAPGCRISEFARWDRTLLEHEREYLSRETLGRAFMSKADYDGLMHDITDIDYLLQQLEPRVKT